MGILDFLTGNNAGASPWGALYPAEDEAAKRTRATGDFLESMGVSRTNLPQISPFDTPQPAAPAAPAGFGAGAVPFGFAGPGSMNVNPSMLIPSANQPSTLDTAQWPVGPVGAPAAPASDLSSVNRPVRPPANAPDSFVPVGKYQMPMVGEAPDVPEAAPKPVAPAGNAPFSLAGGGFGDRLMNATTGFLGNLHNGPVGALAGGLGALVTGRATDPGSIQREKTSATVQALLAKNVPIADIKAAIDNPAMMTALIAQYYGKDKATLTHVEGANGVKIPVWADGANKSVTRAEVPGLDSSGAPPVPTPSQSSRVQAIIDGREPYPAPNSRSADAAFIRDAVHAADPAFDAVNYNSRLKTRQDFTAGKSAQNLSSFNNTVGHIDRLEKSIDGLNNSGFPLWNKLANAISENTDPKFAAALKQFQADRTAVSDELTRAFRGSGGNVHDIKQWEATINSADSPQALRAAVREVAELLNSRIQSVGDQYNRGMGTTKDAVELLSPHAAQTFKRILSGDSGAGPAAAVTSGTTKNNIGWSVK